MNVSIAYQRIHGKTYTLFGESESTEEYYGLIKELADLIVAKFNSDSEALSFIQDFSKNKNRLKRILNQPENSLLQSGILHLLHSSLAIYTQNIEAHLKELSFKKLWDKRLNTSREQYHLYMLEIELTNRIFIKEFLDSDKKIALLPYCLRDFMVECKSKPDEFDYKCGFCSKNCYQNYISRILKENDVEAYIWMEADIKKYARDLYKNGQKLSILGIACIPELVFGMRKCQKYQIPAIGIPLDANRCARWMGEFHKNSVNLQQLELLLKSDKPITKEEIL